MSIRQKIIDVFEAALLVAVGALQLGIWLAIVGPVAERSAQPTQLAHRAETRIFQIHIVTLP